MNIFKNTFLLIAGGTLLAGCGPKVPTCDSPEVVGLVKGITHERIEVRSREAFTLIDGTNKDPSIPEDEKLQATKLRANVADRLKQLEVAIEKIATESLDKDVGKYLCKAELKGSIAQEYIDAMKSNAMAQGMFQAASAMTGGMDMVEALKTPSGPILYTVQLSSDKKQTLVEVKGIDEAVANDYSMVIMVFAMSQLESISGPRLKAEATRKENEKMLADAAESERVANAQAENDRIRAESDRIRAESLQAQRARVLTPARTNPNERPKK